MEDKPSKNVWTLQIAEKLGAVKEMARTNRERIITLEDEVGVDPPASDTDVMDRLDELEEEIQGQMNVTGFWAWLSSTTSKPRKTIATAALFTIVVVLLIMLASYDIDIPFLGAKWVVLALNPNSLRVATRYVYKPDSRKGDQKEQDRAWHGP